jgi:hypothetical protein
LNANHERRLDEARYVGHPVARHGAVAIAATALLGLGYAFESNATMGGVLQGLQGPVETLCPVNKGNLHRRGCFLPAGIVPKNAMPIASARPADLLKAASAREAHVTN